MATAQRSQSFRDGEPRADLVDPVSNGPELQSNKNLSGGRDQARPLNPGLLAGYPQATNGGRKGRKSQTR
jgi:hypothetical protein